MTSSTLFFCTEEEEGSVWKYLLTEEVAALLINPFDLKSVIPVDFDILPAWPEPVTIFFHHKPSGNIQWHRSQPELIEKTHNELVNSLLAREKWKKSGLMSKGGILDIESSPLQIYHRGMSRDEQIGPCELVCPPSNPIAISVKYKKWIERSKRWIRSKSVRVHDWQRQSELLANPLHILTSIYAFPTAREEIESNSGMFAILVR
jgi:hypothetical protein